jgi:hypothetical protein
MLTLVKHGNDHSVLISRIEQLIAKPPENSRIIEFTPEVAQYFLKEHNVGNRSKKQSKITEYADAMKDGKWGLTGDTVKFDTEGVLRDGQNRLSACVRAGASFRTHVIFGVDPKLFMRMDRGRVRNSADIFEIAQVPYKSDTAATIRWLVLLESDNPMSRVTHTPEFLLHSFQDKYSDVVASIRVGQQIRKVWGHPTGAIAALHYLFSKRNEVRADQFFARWQSGQFGKRSDPIKALQERLLSIKAQNHGRIHDGVRNALIIRAWNAFVEDQAMTLAQLWWHEGEDFPKITG